MGNSINLLVDFRLKPLFFRRISNFFSSDPRFRWFSFRSDVLIFRSQINLCLQMVQFVCRISCFYFFWSKKFD